MEIKSYRDLDIWQKGMKIAGEVHKLTCGFPPIENYNLISQMNRSAASIPSNIAEGFRRSHKNEYKQFLFIALGSAAELETQVSLAKNFGYIPEETEKNLLEELNHISRMIINLTKKLKESL